MLTVSAPPRPSRSPTRQAALTGFGAFLLYLVASVAIWGFPVIAHLGSRYVAIGRVGDPDYFRWALAWTPWAIGHGHSPLQGSSVFAPNGIDLTWSTLVPGPAIVAWPITALFGPLVSYNVLMLLAPSLAAWAAFLVCRRVVDRFWPAFAGGYLFGFSAYMAAEMQSHLNLVLIFPVPLAVYLVVRLVEGSMSRWVFVGLLVLTLVGLFSISPEIFATTTFFGAIAFVIAWVVAGSDRVRIARAGLLTIAAYAITGIFLFVPFVLPALSSYPSNLERPAASADLLGFLVPRNQTLIGGTWLRSVSDRFTARVGEDGSYLGVAGIALLTGFAITERRRRGTWALLFFVVAMMILALGSTLHVAGRPSFVLPHTLLSHLPLIKSATPDRFTAYVALAVGVIAAIWLGRARGRGAWIRWSIVVLMGVMLLPSVRTPPWHFEDRTPTFFSSETASTVLRTGEIVALIAGSKGENMSWQASAGFVFRMPWGYVGIGSLAPQGESGAEDVSLDDPRGVPSSQRFARALEAHDVTAVVLGDLARPTYEPLVRSVGLEPVYEGEGVSVWRYPA
jgi:hypothetical protein